MKSQSSRIKPLAVSFLQAAALFSLLSFAVDWRRSPKPPAQSAFEPLHLLSGKTIAPASISQNRVAVLYFWGSWCGICTHTSPSVFCLAREGIPVAGIALRSGPDDAVRAHMSEKQLDFPTSNNPDGILPEKWNVSVTPSIMLIEKGKMIHFTSGFSTCPGLRARILAADLFLYRHPVKLLKI